VIDPATEQFVESDAPLALKVRQLSNRGQFKFEPLDVLHDPFAGALPVAVDGNSPQAPTKGTVGIDTSARPSGSPNYPLDVFAALRADRSKLAMAVVALLPAAEPSKQAANPVIHADVPDAAMVRVEDTY
jgi:hypothetical protein